MRRSLSTIVGLGILAALFMAVMSAVYLDRLPTKAELHRLEEDIRREHGLYLSAIAPLDVILLAPSAEQKSLGLEVHCTLRPDVRKETAAIDVYLDRIADSILTHPEWRGRIRYVTVRHMAEAPRIRTKTRPIPS